MEFSEAMYRLCELLGKRFRAKDEVPEIQRAISSEINALLEELPLEGKSVPCEICGDMTPCTQLSAHPEATYMKHPRLLCVECNEGMAVGAPPTQEEQDADSWSHVYSEDYYDDDERDDYCDRDDYVGICDYDDDEPLCPCGDETCYGGCGVLPCGCIDVHKEWKHEMRAELLLGAH